MQSKLIVTITVLLLFNYPLGQDLIVNNTETVTVRVVNHENASAASRYKRYYTFLLFSLAILFHFVWNSVTAALGVYVILFAIEIVLFILIYWTVPDRLVDPNAIPITIDELFHRKLINES